MIHDDAVPNRFENPVPAAAGVPRWSGWQSYTSHTGHAHIKVWQPYNSFIHVTVCSSSAEHAA
jgi:hypothetical protein